MAFEHPRLLAASLTAAILGTACSTPNGATPNDGTPANADKATTAGTTTPQEPQGPLSIEEQRRHALVQSYLEVAQSLRANGQLQAAKLELLKAKDLAPGNAGVLTLLASVQAELGEPVGTINDYATEQMRLQQIGEERARAEVRTQLQTARQNMADKNFAGAIEELRRAALNIEVKEMDWMDLPQQVHTAKAEAEAGYDEQQRATQAKESALMAERIRREYAETQARKRAQVDSLILESQAAFEKHQFQRSQDLAQRALQIEPNNTIAFEMHNAAVKAGRDSSSDDYARERARALRAQIEAEQELKIPQTDVLVMDPTTWERAQRRAGSHGAAEVVDPQDVAVWDLVQKTPVGRLSYTEETGDYLEVIKNLQLITGVTIISTPEAREIFSGENLKVVIELMSSMSLENFLNHMVKKSTNLAWTVRNGVVIIGNKSQAAGTLTNEVYRVQDLIFAQTQFTPPTVRDIPGEQQSDTPRTGGEGDDKVAGIEIGDLVNALKEATDPEYWNNDGVSITPEDSGLLTVKASPEMQAKVKKTLDDMRRFQTPIVTIDSKFLTISRNFLQEIGVDFRGLGGSGNKGSTVALDDATNGLVSNSSQGLDNGGTGDPAANPLAGFFFNDGGDGDVRGRTENFFANGLGRSLTSNGGLTAGWTFLNDLQMAMILKAVEKHQNGEIVNSQILSVVNKGRGHVAVINQTAYVRDFDVEVAQAAFIADPKVDVIQDGIVLDVQPVILNDRKYIILNLNPTVAELQRPIPTFTTSLAGSTLPVTLQLPNLTVTNFSTTVKVPDGGTVLLGGLRQVLTKERRAEVPVLSRLPLLSILFKQDGQADENKSLMVMVRAQITDVIQK
ncbi:MAG: hypothetical protein IT455_08905 [Planctomycetes bacterium]|nr:hypothetical protein [Planctomycetota bacterium]